MNNCSFFKDDNKGSEDHGAVFVQTVAKPDSSLRGLKVSLPKPVVNNTWNQLTNNEDLLPLALTAIRRLEKLTSINKKISSETINNIKQLKNPSKIADNIASHLNTAITDKQQIFETLSVKKRLISIIKIIENPKINKLSFIGNKRFNKDELLQLLNQDEHFQYINTLSSNAQTQLDTKATKGFSIAMGVALG